MGEHRGTAYFKTTAFVTVLAVAVAVAVAVYEHVTCSSFLHLVGTLSQLLHISDHRVIADISF